ncbi:MAG TPA: tripartite tricarboxylate transporter substrate binding protein [Burkholderiales bacterium]|nr:tripartite tricarboxylate transporter substrate binding protein [Burkholderiales bacterium]
MIPAGAHAQGGTQAASVRGTHEFPLRPIKLVVPFPPGGSSDARARQLASRLEISLRQPVIVENRPGASGFIGSEFVARAAPDGYTLLLGTVGTLAINHSLFAQMPYDTLRDFDPVSQMSAGPLILAAHPALGVSSVAELVTLAKAKPGAVPYASNGNGSIQHITGEAFKRFAGIDLLHVPFQGTAPSTTALLAGHVGVMFETPQALQAYIKAGRLRALAVTSEQRLASLPEVPTMRESGFPALRVETWQGIVAPKGTPVEVLGRLSAEISRVLRQPDVAASYDEVNTEVVGNTPSQFEALIRSETAKWSEWVRVSGARVD